MDRDYHISVGEFYEARNEVDEKKATEEAFGDGATPETLEQYKLLAMYEAMMSELRAAERDGNNGQRTYEYEPYIIGMARAALGKEPLERFPNPMEYKLKDLPRPVRSVLVEELKDASKRLVDDYMKPKTGKDLEKRLSLYKAQLQVDRKHLLTRRAVNRNSK